MSKITLPIKGMHCRSCEILIKEKLEEVKNIKRVDVQFKEKKATVYSISPLDMDLVADAIEETGYRVGKEEPKSWIIPNPKDYKDLGLSIVIALVLFFIGTYLGLFNINVKTDNPSGLIAVLLIGLTAGVSTCMALIGGLILGVSARHNEKHPSATALQNFRPHIFFNLGRILSYFILGGLIGMIGKVFQLSSSILGGLMVIVGIIMLILGLKLIDIFPKLSNSSFSLPSSIHKFLRIKEHHKKEYSHLNSMIIGALTFFLPCGFTQALQLYAMTTGSFLSGALIMSTFALGTAPGLLSIGGLASVIKGDVAKFFFKFSGIVVISLAVFNIFNGYNLTGWTWNIGPAAPSQGQSTNVSVENGIQIAKMTQTSMGYTPNTFIIKKDIPVRWTINAKEMGACTSGLNVPQINITKNLHQGENVIEFTPTQIGKIKFTCLMGMYPGEFIVIDNK